MMTSCGWIWPVTAGAAASRQANGVFTKPFIHTGQKARAILHAHPVNCAALACLGKGIPAFHYMVAIAGGKDIRCADYASFGTSELSDHVIKAMENRKACLMAHHGLTCFAEDLPGALALAIEIEQLAAVYSRILSIGEAKILDDEEMAKVLKKFSSYGVQD